jgi:hypothetical protein
MSGMQPPGPEALVGYRRPRAGTQPEYLHPPYKS